MLSLRYTTKLVSSGMSFVGTSSITSSALSSAYWLSNFGVKLTWQLKVGSEPKARSPLRMGSSMLNGPRSGSWTSCSTGIFAAAGATPQLIRDHDQSSLKLMAWLSSATQVPQVARSSTPAGCCLRALALPKIHLRLAFSRKRIMRPNASPHSYRGRPAPNIHIPMR
jgi:hypothetical protein